jgi:hypothetical protein
VVEGDVGGGDEVRRRRNFHALGRDGKPQAAQRRHLFQQALGVDHHAVAEHADDMRLDQAGRQQVQLEDARALRPIHRDRVAGVVAAGIAGHNVGLGRQQVGDAAFALIAPLGADNDVERHVATLTKDERRRTKLPIVRLSSFVLRRLQ